MTLLTLDASVVCKWFLQDASGEDDLCEARALMDAIEAQTVSVLQPPHTMAEALGVLVRRRPKRVAETVVALTEAALPVWDTAKTYVIATQLAIDTGAHLFDTLYHAVALETGGTLVTADERYVSVAAGAGHIATLRGFKLSASG